MDFLFDKNHAVDEDGRVPSQICELDSEGGEKQLKRSQDPLPREEEFVQSSNGEDDSVVTRDPVANREVASVADEDAVLTVNRLLVERD